MKIHSVFKFSNLPLLFLIFSLLLAYHQVFHGLVVSWLQDDNNSHGFIVPVVSAYLVWQRRDKLLNKPLIPSDWGLLLIVFGILMLVVGWLATEYFSMRFSFIVILAGCVIFWFGWSYLAILAGPIVYLVLMVPIPAIVYDAVAFPLKVLVSKVSVAIMKTMGIMVVREGNVMAFPNITLEVVNACSGLRSLTSLLAIGLAYMILFVHKFWHRVIVVAMIFPVALAANMVRVVGTGVLAQYFGAVAAEGFFHEFAGLVIFLVSISMLVGTHALLRRWSR